MPIAPSRIFHVNVNCSDLERSLAFYRDAVGLKASTRTKPEAPQPGAAFGLDEVHWDAWIMQGDAGYDSPVLDLLQWLVPGPAGTPATDPTATGFNRLCFTSPDLDAVHGRLAGAGGDCWSPPTTLDLGGGQTLRMFVCSDPDGTQLEFIEGPDTRMSHIAVNCQDLDASVRHYADVVGLTQVIDLPLPRQVGTPMRIDGDMEVRSVLMRDSASGFMVELMGWQTPRPVVAPARRANDLGIFRMAWLTDGIDRDHAALLAAGVTPYSPPAHLSMGPGLPDLRALFWGDPDGACLELIESPA